MIRLGPNLLAPEASARDRELMQPLAAANGVRIERIVSFGQASPEGFWYDQPEAEWVTLLTGRARISIAGQDGAIAMVPGDTLLLPAHCRHRVDWTDPEQPTVWLAVFVAPELVAVPGAQVPALSDNPITS